MGVHAFWDLGIHPPDDVAGVMGTSDLTSNIPACSPLAAMANQLKSEWHAMINGFLAQLQESSSQIEKNVITTIQESLHEHLKYSSDPPLSPGKRKAADEGFTRNVRCKCNERV